MVSAHSIGEEKLPLLVVGGGVDTGWDSLYLKSAPLGEEYSGSGGGPRHDTQKER